MKEYLYLWIKEAIPKDDFGLKKRFQIENQGISLSSKYKINHLYKKKEQTLFFNVQELPKKPEHFFSENFIDIKALVGRNGSGKTTILKQLFYQIIADEFGQSVDNEIDFVLIYAKNGEIFYYKSRFLKCKCKIHFAEKTVFKSQAKRTQDIKAERTIFFTAAFSSNHPLGGMRVLGEDNLSTNALLSSDNETLYNISKKFHKRVEKGTNFYNSHYTMELIRKVFFITHFYNVLANNPILKFRVPNGIILEPSNIDIENAVIEISNDDKEKKKIWMDLNKKIHGFENRFRFAALLNHIRADLSNNSMRTFIQKKLNDFLDPVMIEKNGIIETIETYAEQHIIESEKGFPHKIEKALSLTKKILYYKKKLSNKHPFINNDSIYFDLNNKKHRMLLEEFINSYMKIMRLTPFLFMNIRTQSSGEEKFIELFSRLYFDLYMRKRYENQNKNDAETHYNTPADIHMIIDEVDLYLHPEWQRNWLSEFIKIIKILMNNIYPNNKPKIQLFISTHSPFIITDLPKNNITLLDLDQKMRTIVYNDHKLNPFGANLYDLLSNGFFVKNSIGAFSEHLIENAVRYKRGMPITDSLHKKNLLNAIVNYTIESIGDPIIWGLLNEIEDVSKTSRKK